LSITFVQKKVRNRQKEAWQTPLGIYILDRHQQPSRYTCKRKKKTR